MKKIILFIAALVFAPLNQANAISGFPIIEKIEKSPEFVKNEILCLSKTIFFEARNSTRKDQIWAGYVAYNRIAHPIFSDTICDVVYEDSQFSWTKNEKQRVRDNETERKAWEEIQNLAYDIYAGKIPDPTNGVTHFYNTAMKKKPAWAKTNKKQKTSETVVGRHAYVDISTVGKVKVYNHEGFEIVK